MELVWNHRRRQVIEVEPFEIGSPILVHKVWLGRPGSSALEEEVHSPHMRFALPPVNNDQWQGLIGVDCDAKLFLDFPGGCLMSRLMGSTWPAAAVAHYPSRYPVPCRSCRSTKSSRLKMT